MAVTPVLSVRVSAHSFLRGCERLTALACPKGVTTADPCAFFAAPPRCHVSGTRALAWDVWESVVIDRTAECCVRHSRAGHMRAHNALPHSHVLRGSTRQPLHRDSTQLAGIGRYCRFFPIPRFDVFSRYCRESQGSSRYCRPP